MPDDRVCVCVCVGGGIEGVPPFSSGHENEESGRFLPCFLILSSHSPIQGAYSETVS